MIITNNHILPTAQLAGQSACEFGFSETSDFMRIEINPTFHFITSEILDYTVVSIGRNLDITPISLNHNKRLEIHKVELEEEWLLKFCWKLFRTSEGRKAFLLF